MTLSPQRLIEKYGTLQSVLWAGTGAHQHSPFLEESAGRLGIVFAKDLIESAGPERDTIWRLAVSETNLARHAAALALQLFNRGKVQSAQSIQAIYVRPSDAELNEQCR